MSAGLLDKPTQQLICVDRKGKETGRIIDRRSAHSFPGVKHLAIQILVFNSNNEIILHDRPAKKVGGGVLDAPTTHILHGETKEDSARRCLRDEYGILEKIPIKILGGYSYEKDYGDGSCENEFCIATYTVYEGKIIPNNEQMEKIVIVSAKKFLNEINSGNKKYPVWLIETVKIILKDKSAKKLFE